MQRVNELNIHAAQRCLCHLNEFISQGGMGGHLYLFVFLFWGNKILIFPGERVTPFSSLRFSTLISNSQRCLFILTKIINVFLNCKCSRPDPFPLCWLFLVGKPWQLKSHLLVVETKCWIWNADSAGQEVVRLMDTNLEGKAVCEC